MLALHQKPNLALAVGFSFLLGAVSASAAVTWSGLVNGGSGIAIPADLTGVYLDLDDPDDAASFATFNDDNLAASTDWDLNIFFNGIAMAYSPTRQPARADSGDTLSRMLNVAPGTTVDDSLIDYLGIPGSDFGGSGQANGSSVGESHFGPGAGYFQSNSAGHIAFILNPDSPSDKRYGWMEVTLVNGSTSQGKITQWALSDMPLAVGTIPA